MKLIIAGSRHLTSITRFDLESFTSHFGLFDIKEIVSGCCKTGPDNAAYWHAKHNAIEFKGFPAQWEKYGKMAGPMRNGQMAAYGDALLLVWDGESKGSASMKARMSAMKKPIYEVVFKRST